MSTGEGRDHVAAEFLGELERREAGLLGWGLVDGSFDEREVEEAARDFLERRCLTAVFADETALVDHAEELGLIFRFRSRSRRRYRTRMGETVRLMLRLRQLFPRHADGSWRTAPRLVADARFVTRPRKFPRRDLAVDRLISSLGGSGRTRADVLRALVGDRALAGFQLRATVRVLTQIGRDAPSGTIVTAATGGGKTLAFYLPALTSIVETLSRGDWVRCLAIYPRTELLKDQFSETLAQCRRLIPTLRSLGLRKIRLGAFFGPTPRDATAFDSRWPPAGWRRLAQGYECPMLRCPVCSKATMWSHEDRHRNPPIERLRCVDPGCLGAVEADEVVLTRSRLRREPPDVLFTTTEMLNQRLGDSRFGGLFGVGKPPAERPRLLLLDEAHTYSGTTGAQTAFLLRRWAHRTGCRPHVVGLSATLREARDFFAALTGLPDAAVEVCSAERDEVEERGAEYLLALRGDPASGASLLSTTIQTAMLTSRVLDAPRDARSRGFYGTKSFLFTDDLDVTNRLFFDLRDAEGQDSWGRRKANDRTGSLATLRASAAAEPLERFADGQSWDVCERLGHLLRPDAERRVGRTSSQDAGVEAEAEQIVATAALEVGFNDPDVGAVIQHKAPLDAAAFLQRKGRAGRHPRMRPWTIVVLSDYGRDRAAYHAYDLLFDPELPARELPLGNRHVLRVQAAFALLDWLAAMLDGQPGGSVWQDAAVPNRERSPYERPTVAQRQRRVADLLEEVLTLPERRAEVVAYVQNALRLSSDETDVLLWEPPRPLLLAVVPTLLRRLRSQWRGESFVPNAPLPEFVPRTLFEELSVPEIFVATPPAQAGDPPGLDAMRAGAALNEFAPGRVSRRFGVKHRFARHWVAPPELAGDRRGALPVSRFVPAEAAEPLGVYEFVDDDGRTRGVPCRRPHRIVVERPPETVVDSSNAFPVWRTQIAPFVDGIVSAAPTPDPWAKLVAETRFFTHVGNCPIEIRRFALGSNASISLRSGERFDARIDFTDDRGAPAAIGFAHDADAVVFRLRVPERMHEIVVADEPLLRSLRPAFFRHLVQSDPTLDGVVNVFGRDWLAQAFVSGAIADAGDGDLSTAVRGRDERRLRTMVAETLSALFQATGAEVEAAEDDSQIGEDDDPSRRGRGPSTTGTRGLERLQTALVDPRVVAALARAAPALWEEPDASWDPWLRRRLIETFGVGALDAVARLCPDVDAGGVLVDPAAGPRPAGTAPAPADAVEVWLTETTVGGGGVLEKFQRRFGEDPRSFFEHLSRSVDATDFETADAELTRFVETIAEHPEGSLAAATRRVRDARERRHEELSAAFRDLLGRWRVDDCDASHSVVAALSNRLLRAGTSERSDRFARDLIRRRDEIESRLKIELDSRTFAWIAADVPAVVADLETVVGAQFEDRVRRAAAIASLLWPRGTVARAAGFAARNPYTALGTPERLLIHAVLPPPPPRLDLDAAEGEAATRAALVSDGEAHARGGVETARRAVLRFAAVPVDAGAVLGHARVRSAERAGREVLVDWELPEVLR